MDGALPQAEFGFDLLQSPTDICLLPTDNSEVDIAVSDDLNGVLVFSKMGVLKKHVKECKDAGSLCFSKPLNSLVVSSDVSATKGGETAYRLSVLQKNTNGEWQFQEGFDIPSDPSIKGGYIRWVQSHPTKKLFYVASGDNSTAVLWKFTYDTKTWSVLLKRSGDLEHPSVIESQPEQTDIYLNVWDEDGDWRVAKFSFDAQDQLQNEEAVILANKDLQYPFSCAVDASGRIICYDYKGGTVWRFLGKTSNMFATVLAGQWVSLDVWNDMVFLACAEQKCIKCFKMA